MEKYFIADKYLQDNSSGLYCINGFGNKSTQFFVTSLSAYQDCNHTTCCGNILEIKKDYRLFVNVISKMNLASGDTVSKSYESVIMLLYNEKEIISVIPTSNKDFVNELGDDCTFLLTTVAKQFHQELKCDLEEKSNNTNIKKEQKSHLLRILDYSYIVRWIRCRKRDIRKHSAQSLLSSMIMECALAILFILVLGRVMLSYESNVNEEVKDDKLRLEFMINTFVRLLQDLLTWLMGVPVGLKLNRQFSKVLGQFYMFHVAIWENYMTSSVVPLLPYLLRIVPLLVPLGISFFLCAVLDITALVTLHLTCFYVYACKLYRLQVIILCSLFRLFHGQKWNPFRARVDTGPAEIDRLFASTLILALSIFLLPTTALYYLVFASVELVRLSLQYLLSSLLIIIYRLPVLDIVTWLLDHPRHRRLLHITKMTDDAQCLLLRLKFTRCPLATILHASDPKYLKDQSQLSIHEIISSLLKGHLIKKW